MTHINWIFPQAGWAKCKIDGAAMGNPAVAIRNEDGSWLVGFSNNIVICPTYVAELLSILIGLQIAWNISQ